jgi:hypothetical protein
MGAADYSDRVWCTILWEMMRFTEHRLSDSADLESSLADAINTGFLPVEQATADQLANPLVIRIIHAVAPGLFLRFLRENPEILDPAALVAWVQARQPQFPEDRLRELDDTPRA